MKGVKMEGGRKRKKVKRQKAQRRKMKKVCAKGVQKVKRCMVNTQYCLPPMCASVKAAAPVAGRQAAESRTVVIMRCAIARKMLQVAAGREARCMGASMACHARRWQKYKRWGSGRTHVTAGAASACREAVVRQRAKGNAAMRCAKRSARTRTYKARSVGEDPR